jgi:hypothetical protein
VPNVRAVLVEQRARVPRHGQYARRNRRAVVDDRTELLDHVEGGHRMCECECGRCGRHIAAFILPASHTVMVRVRGERGSSGVTRKAKPRSRDSRPKRVISSAFA